MTAIRTKPIERSKPNMSDGSMKQKYDAYSPPVRPTTAPDNAKIRSWSNVADTPTSAEASTSALRARSGNPRLERRERTEGARHTALTPRAHHYSRYLRSQ